MVFLTPYVVKGSDQAQAEAQRRLNNTNTDGVWSRGWSDSQLAEPENKRTLLNKEKRKLDQQKKELEAKEELDKLYKEKGLTPPAVKVPAPTPTIESAGPMRVIEETTEPLLMSPAPAPEKAPAVE